MHPCAARNLSKLCPQSRRAGRDYPPFAVPLALIEDVAARQQGGDGVKAAAVIVMRIMGLIISSFRSQI